MAVFYDQKRYQTGTAAAKPSLELLFVWELLNDGLIVSIVLAPRQNIGTWTKTCFKRILIEFCQKYSFPYLDFDEFLFVFQFGLIQFIIGGILSGGI